MTPTEWLLSGDIGTSSKTICAVMTESLVGSRHIGNPPGDNDDFGRCYRLLKHFPAWRLQLYKVANYFPEWGPMVDAWSELETLWESYCNAEGHVTPKEYRANKDVAKKMFTRMRELQDLGRLADGWKKDGPGSWSKDKRSIINLGSMSIET